MAHEKARVAVGYGVVGKRMAVERGYPLYASSNTSARITKSSPAFRERPRRCGSASQADAVSTGTPWG